MSKIFMSGMTLIEVMISLTISVLILSSISAIFLATEKSYQTQVALATIQENARIATELLRADIRMAGYIGCPRLTAEFNVINNIFYLTEKNKLTSYSDNEIKPNSDAITIRHASSNHAVLMKTMRGYSTLYTSIIPHFTENEVLLISNYKSAEFFKVKSISRHQGMQKIVATQPLTQLYEQNTEVSQFEMNTYFIAETERHQDDGSPIYALYVKYLNQHVSEMVEGIDNMKIDFAIEENGSIKEQPAKLFQGDAKIVGVSVSLALSSLSHSQISHKPWYFYVALR